MDRDFVEPRDDGSYLVGSRVPLDCVVREFREGQSPEAIRFDFPTLMPGAGLRCHHLLLLTQGPGGQHGGPRACGGCDRRSEFGCSGDAQESHRKASPLYRNEAVTRMIQKCYV